MVAPIITFVFAGIIGFLAWKTSTVEAYLPEDKGNTPVAEAPAADAPEEAEAEPADEPAPAEPAEEPADEFEKMVEPPSDDEIDTPADDFDF